MIGNVSDWFVASAHQVVLGAFRAAGVPMDEHESGAWVPAWAVDIFESLPLGEELFVLRAAVRSVEFRAAAVTLIAVCEEPAQAQALFDLLDCFPPLDDTVDGTT